MHNRHNPATFHCQTGAMLFDRVILTVSLLLLAFSAALFLIQ
jgi:hypothetical protein